MRTLLILICALVFSHAAIAGSKKALVIGNSEYFDPSLPQDQQPSNLKNPANDAALMNETFRKIGFDVSFHTDLDSQGMKKALGDFRSILNPGDIAVVYFSGHGFQIKGENYLIPVHFAAKFEYQATAEALSLSMVVDALEEAGLNLKIIFLDCCRNDPRFRSFSKGSARGLGEVKNTGHESLVCFSTKHGEVAEDNPESSNSNYTSALGEILPMPGLKVEDVMKRVAQKVMLLSNNSQQPFTYGNLFRDWYLGPEGTAPPAPPSPSADQTALIAQMKKLQDEIERMKTVGSPPPATIPAPNPAPIPVAPVDNTRDSILNFLKSWWAGQFSNDTSDWVSEFAPMVDYCYGEGSGRSTQRFIMSDRQKLISKWPNREYEILNVAGNPSYTVTPDGQNATLTVRYKYSYSGGSKSASGVSRTVLGLERVGSRWQISSFDESVERN